jgi:hypothetical protein
MAFTTPFCARYLECHCLRIALVVLLISGCSQDERAFGFSLERVETSQAAGELNVVVHQKLALSREAQEALNHGVPLSFRTELALRPAGSRRDIQQHKDFEIRYLPLSDRYQLTTVQQHSVRTFPRLRHVLAEISSVSFTLPVKPAPAAQFELRARSLLDRRRMPPPMRLPVLFSSQWQHDSGWRTWKLSDTLPKPGSGLAARPPGA